jgi:Family of unknown function (DUF6345)
VTNSKRFWALVVALGFLGGLRLEAADRKEGGYVGTYTEGHDAVVYNFLKHFNYQQYYYSRPFQFGSSNNARVDAMDMAIFGGHGNRWYIGTTDGGIDLSNVGSGGNAGWGDFEAEFVAFESCYVVPSPIEVADWWTGWIRTPNGPMDGVHQILSFHTVSWQSTDEDVTDFFGSRMAGNHSVWQSWFDAINSEGRSDEHGSAVMHPSTDGDRYATFVADPPKNHQSLRLWYQY